MKNSVCAGPDQAILEVAPHRKGISARTRVAIASVLSAISVSTNSAAGPPASFPISTAVRADVRMLLYAAGLRSGQLLLLSL
jgi:hypothetical protein